MVYLLLAYLADSHELVSSLMIAQILRRLHRFFQQISPARGKST